MVTETRYERVLSYEPHSFRSLIDYLNSTDMTPRVIEGGIEYTLNGSTVTILGVDGSPGKVHLRHVEKKLFSEIEKKVGKRREVA